MPSLEKDKKVSSEVSVSWPAAGFLLRYRRIFIFLAHVGAFAVALVLSFLLANNMEFKREWLTIQCPFLFIFFIIIKVPVFGFFKQYRGWWRYVGISDLTGILRASLVSTFIIVGLWFIVLEMPEVRQNLSVLTGISQSIFVLDLFATILLLSGVRMAARLYYEEFKTEEGSRLKRLMIVGAGNAGEALLREIHRMQVAHYQVVGFIDDDPVKRGIRIHGLPVLGMVEELAEICEQKNIEEIAIAMPSATHKQLRRVVQVCSGTKAHFMTVPSITDIASGKYKVSQIRDIDINDLLGREAVQLEFEQIESFLCNKVIMVTGAGGSIGSEMCRQVCKFKPKQLLLVEQAENPLFHIHGELLNNFPDLDLVAIICDIVDARRVDGIFAEYRPEVVIHAAAHKHVPLMEMNPGEGIKNNVIGTCTVAKAADKYGAANFVMISTDKAVNPTSLMGSSKRIAEMCIQSLNATSPTKFVTVRFGNVLGSNGSVVPIFKNQIAKGGPVTVTHPDMQRYFMTIPEASQLVLQAAAMGRGNEIFLLDMGEPVKIVDLARELIILSGFRPDDDIEIVFSGLRPGEKLFEELNIEGEDMLPTRHPKISVSKNVEIDVEKLHQEVEKLIELAHKQDRDAIVAQVKKIVPEYIGDSYKAEPIVTTAKA